MYQGRYMARKQPVRRKKLNKLFLVTLSVFLLLGMVVGGTVAYVMNKTDKVTNTFTPGKVTCTVNDEYKVKVGDNTKAFVRAAVVVNWVNANGEINGIAPVESRDYTVTMEENTKWEAEADGYYYYKDALEPGNSTTRVCTVTPVSAAPEGFSLSVEILAEAIQAEGMGATSAQDAWAKAQNN